MPDNCSFEMKNVPIWRKIWFWAFLVVAVTAFVALLPSTDPFAGRWVLQSGEREMDSGNGGLIAKGYELSRFGRFRRFGYEVEISGRYRRKGAATIILEMTHVTGTINGARKTESLKNSPFAELMKPIELHLTIEGRALETDEDPWVGRTTMYLKED